MIIEFEGPDGVGKTTLAAAVAAHVRAEGRPVLAVREPGHVKGEASDAELLRTVFLGGLKSEKAQTLVLLAARAESHRLQRSWLDQHPEGVIVRDRGDLSVIAYQGAKTNVKLALTEFRDKALHLERLRRVLILPPAGTRPFPGGTADPARVLAYYRKIAREQPLMAGLVIDRARDDAPVSALVGRVIRYAFTGGRV